jgi:hypothetical protein
MPERRTIWGEYEAFYGLPHSIVSAAALDGGGTPAAPEFLARLHIRAGDSHTKNACKFV